LVSIHTLPESQQKDAIQNEFHSWKNEYDQTDDVLVMGFRI
jgi:ubiquinone/menaquinone biosynthesis C-methylase UbiE